MFRKFSSWLEALTVVTIGRACALYRKFVPYRDDKPQPPLRGSLGIYHPIKKSDGNDA